MGASAPLRMYPQVPSSPTCASTKATRASTARTTASAATQSAPSGSDLALADLLYLSLACSSRLLVRAQLAVWRRVSERERGRERERARELLASCPLGVVCVTVYI